MVTLSRTAEIRATAQHDVPRAEAMLAAGKREEALQLHQQLIPLLDLAFAETNPGPMKSVWDLVGVQAPHLLAPLVNCNPDTSARLRNELQARLLPEAQLG